MLIIIVALLVASSGAFAPSKKGVINVLRNTKENNEENFRRELEKITKRLATVEEDNKRLKEDNKELKEDNTKTNKRLATVEEDNKGLKEDNKELKEANTKTNKRIDGIVGAFNPASIFAIMETSIYEFSSPPADLAADPRKAENFKHLLARSASFILEPLTSDKPPEHRKATSKLGQKFDNKTKDEARRSIVAGLVAFVDLENIATQELIDWPPERNVLVHNGVLLDRLFFTVNSDNTPTLTQEQVFDVRANLELHSRDKPYVDCEGGVVLLLHGLQKRCISVTDEALVESISCLNEICPVEPKLNATSIMQKFVQDLHNYRDLT